MSDNKTKIKPQDSSKININEDYEVQYWTKTLGCTKQELKNAVEKAGVSAEAVRKFLKEDK
ncbi:MAG: hypothetical protein K0R26_2032 [Bacteroidota bacterium]|jgi:hypothetical protein|nr:hypothetical protein [Bacteroidota bacterium]